MVKASHHQNPRLIDLEQRPPRNVVRTWSSQLHDTANDVFVHGVESGSDSRSEDWQAVRLEDLGNGQGGADKVAAVTHPILRKPNVAARVVREGIGAGLGHA